MEGKPAVVQDDRIVHQCAIHQVPSPTDGSPIPSPSPLPFSAPLTLGLASKVTIGGKPVAVQDSSGLNTPAHVGVHSDDDYFAPNLQEGKVVKGSGSVFAEGKPVAYTGCAVSACGNVPAQVAGSASTVLIGA